MARSLSPFRHQVIALFGGGTAETASPNEIYREWLETNVGQQQVMWDWDMWSEADNTIEVRFKNRRHAIDFALRYGNSTGGLYEG